MTQGLQVDIHYTAALARFILLQINPLAFVAPEKVEDRVSFGLVLRLAISGGQVNIKRL